MAGKRRRFTAQEKVRVLKRRLVDKEAVPEICEKDTGLDYGGRRKNHGFN